MSEAVIRPADLDDASAIADRIKGAHTPDEIREQISFFSSKRDEGWEHLVAVDDGLIVGNIVVMPTRYFPPGERHRAELADIVIYPTHQGSGLLERLVVAAAEHARQHGATQLETSAWESNTRAVAAYRKVGFEEWGRVPNAIRNEDGSYDSLVCYAKVIS